MMNTIPLETLISKRTPYQHAAAPFVVLWSQKAGCTSIFKWFLWHAGLLEEAEQYCSHQEGLSIHNYEMEVFRLTPDYPQQLIARIESGAPIISFLRCPYARAFSSYMHLHSRFYIRYERDGLTNQGFELRNTILQSIYGGRPPVEHPMSFVDYLDWLGSHSITDIEPHHAQQRTALHDLPNVRHFRLENLDQVLPELECEFKLVDSTPVNSKFHSPHHLTKSPMSKHAFTRLCERGISLSRSPSYVLPEVNRDLFAGTPCGRLIEQIFHADIALYDGPGNRG